MKINYPTEAKGQLYVPGINTILFTGCIGIVLFFKNQQIWKLPMDWRLLLYDCNYYAFANFLVLRHRPALIYMFLVVYFTLKFTFLFANIGKFPHGGYVTLIQEVFLFIVMYVWYKARKIKNRYVEFVRLDHYIPKIEELSNDKFVPKYATHLVYLTSADNTKEIEHKIIYSILNSTA